MYYTVIRTENLTKTFGTRTAVNNLNVQVEPGEVFGMLGPEGAGKSTLVRLLLNATRPTSGRALVMGYDAQRALHLVRARVGSQLLPAALAEMLDAGEYFAFQAALRQNIDLPFTAQAARRLELDLKKPILMFTPAERQKLGIIQAFMRRPELVILDEPTRSLNDREKAVFYQLAADCRAAGGTVFFTTASLSEAERVCDRVGVMHAGNLLCVERAIRLRARAMLHVEMRFAAPVNAEAFAGLENLEDLRVEHNRLRCLLRGDPTPLLNAASRFHVTDYFSRQPTLEEAFARYYGVTHAAR